MQEFDDAVTYIKAHSLAGADKVTTDILAKIHELLKNPERYNPDKYKKDNDGGFRAFEMHHYRVSYRYKAGEIRIIRVRHTRMNPLSY